MKNEILKQIISQIKKYDLAGTFSDIEEFKKWVSDLNNTQVNNFLSLDINLEEIRKLRHLLINKDLLNCKDYRKKVDAISTLKNGEGCWHMFNTLCKPNFLNSKNFYKDIEMLSKADTARYCLWVLGEDSFINSPYHDVDLKLIVETYDTNKEKKLDFLVSEALATVAGDIDSIKSPYHQEDMKLISTAGSECLQMSGSFPEHSLNNLAIDKVSLKDKYHLENMKILATNPVASEFLYIIMTDPNFVKGKNYRKEIEALVNAKSKTTARALYYYIVNPDRKYLSDMDFLKDYSLDEYDVHLNDNNSVAGSNDPNYLKNLTMINNIDDKFVMYFVSLLMNFEFINSPYKNFDLELLQNTSNKEIFTSLYKIMSNKESINSIHHKKDAIIISQTMNKNIRELLLKSATNKYSLNSNNHEYDIEYITNLEIDSINKDVFDKINYYLLRKKGVESLDHREKLEQLSKGILVDIETSVSNYLNFLEKEIDNAVTTPIIESVDNSISKPKTKILKLFKK